MALPNALLLALVVGGSTATADVSPRDIVCGEIVAHARFKREVVHLPLADRERLHAAMGIALGDSDSEAVAIYVHERLDDEAIDLLAADGVRVNRGLFVPPVPGRHPHGFHLAQMAYASMDRVRRDPRFLRVVSVEHLMEPEHEIGLGMVGIAPLHAGVPYGPYLGDGVVVAVADSGLDLDHPDLPPPGIAFDVTTGDWVPDWSTNVANTASMHGTHVAGTVVGSGLLSGGVYRGGAPEAFFAFYKIGNNSTGSAPAGAILKSVSHAAAVGAGVYTVSYGGYDTYLDGSSATAQAFDAAFAAGTLCFKSAGNSAQSGRHYSALVAPDDGMHDFSLVINNAFSSAYTSPINLRVIWRDVENHDDLNVTLECLDLGAGESFTLAFTGTSPRNTEAKRYVLTPSVPANSSRTYTLRLTNNAIGGETPLIHVYQTSTSIATFPQADPAYTISSPGDADTVVTVGAWAHRDTWVNFAGNSYSSTQTADTLATFSSRGPRIDGLLKPEVVAPGTMTISLRDGTFANSFSRIISNNGVNDGNGPANYYAASGTSMAAPLAAAGAVLIRQALPLLSAAEVRARLLSTASNADAPNTLVGHGMVNVFAAVTPDSGQPLGDLNDDGIVDGTDLGILLSSWGECRGCIADINGDGVVDGTDLDLMLGNWTP